MSFVFTRRSLVLFLISFGITFAFLVIVATALAATGDAGTADPKPPSSLVLPTDQLWALLAGSVVPLFTYLLNTYAPWTSEAVKALVLAIGAAIAAGVVQAVTAGDVGLNQVTLQFVVTGVVAAFIAHAQVWLRIPELATKLGSGQNRNLERD